MIKRQDKFTHAAFFYAIDFSEPRDYKVHENVFMGVTSQTTTIVYDAVWFKRKNGVVTVVEGNLHSSFRGVVAEDAIEEEFMKNFDGRYGGDAEFRWDGENIWGPHRTFKELTEAQIELDSYLKDFPNIPEGYTGWYSIK